MKKSCRVVVSLLILVVLLLSIPGICSAAQLPPPPADQISKDPDKSIVVYTRSDEDATRGAVLISMCRSAISNNFDGTVTIEGTTETFNIVDSISVKIYLQRWNGSDWVDVTSRTFSKSNNCFVTGAPIIPVSSGYYYRTQCVHSATDNGESDGASSTSNAILVN